jgi:hypothetical protein
MAQAEGLPSKCKALSSKPSTAKNNNEERRKVMVEKPKRLY